MRRLLLLLVMATTTAACGGDAAAPPDVPGSAPAYRSITLAPAVEAEPAFEITGDGLSTELVEQIRKVGGVAVATGLASAQVQATDRRSASVEIAAVDPMRFRSITPDETTEAEFVWTALLAGQAVISYDTVSDLRFNGGSVTIGVEEAQVGAIAYNGAPENLADVLVAGPLAERLGLEGIDSVVVGAEPGADLEQLEADLERIVAGAELHPLEDEDVKFGPASTPSSVPAETDGYAQGSLIGIMNFEIEDDGYIKPDPAWVEANIVEAEVPVLGSVTCHRLVIQQMTAALNEIVERGLAEHLRPDDYGGCWVPRFIDRDPRNPLSMHAFGLAFDVNVSTNALGTEGDLAARIVEGHDHTPAVR